jgi:hypothetical protein
MELKMGDLVSKTSDALFGKPKQAAAPDYTGAAQATAAGNLEAAKYATVANRANQYNPYGSVTWERGATDYDPWTQRTNFTPQGQQLFDLQTRQDLAYAQTAAKGFDTVKGMFESPNIDTSGMPQFSGVDVNALARAPINAGTTAQEAMLSRLNPSLANDEEALRTRLANQGIGLGSSAYSREMGLQGQRGNDLRLQAAAQGISLDQAARQQGLNEQLAIAGLNSGQRAQMLNEAYTAQSRPLDLINSLRTGSQVQNPQFSSYAQQASTQGADLMGAANAQYGARLDAANAQNARQNALMQGLFSLGGAALGSKG